MTHHRSQGRRSRVITTAAIERQPSNQLPEQIHIIRYISTTVLSSPPPISYSLDLCFTPDLDSTSSTLSRFHTHTRLILEQHGPSDAPDNANYQRTYHGRYVSLSYVSYRSSLTINSTIENQRTSPLLRLPAELRNKIYEYALSGDVRVCFPGTCDECWQKIHEPPPRHFGGCISLLQTCRQAYTEAKLLPFTLDTFSDSTSDLIHYLGYKFEEWQLNAVTSVKVCVEPYHVGLMHEHGTLW